MTGQLHIARRPALITTVLGSCISVCLWDRHSCIGAINHFALPQVPHNKQPSNKYGELAMRNLLRGMLRLGIDRQDMVAMVYGGGNVIEDPTGTLNIGYLNTRFAKDFLFREGIRVTRSQTGSNHGRKITFNTLKGTVEVLRVNSLPEAMQSIIRPCA